jgi:hypothetical protein
MKFTVTGADAKTGDDHVLIIDAANLDDAQSKARSMGLLVASIEPRNPPPTAPPTPATPPRDDDEAMVKLYLSKPVKYFGLQIAGSVLGVSAILLYVAAFGAFLAAIHPASSGGTDSINHDALGMVDAQELYIAYALLFFSAGAIQHGLSAACLALRDIAINSFAK